MRLEGIRLAINELFRVRQTAVSLAGTAENQEELSRLNALIPNTAWQPDPAWLAALPSLLCGPIVRKVQPDEVTVWLALKSPANVTLTVFDRHGDGQKGNVMFSGSLATVPLGAHMHVAAVTAKPGPSPPRLVRGSIYYYDLGWNNETLAAHRADLVYGDQDPLPSFVVPPLELNDLRILHGSCRNFVGAGYDATPNLDHLLERSWDKTNRKWTSSRPHQLFLTGDQIYADEGNDILLNLVGMAGDALLAGFTGNAPTWEEELPSARDGLMRIDPANKKPAETAGGLKNPSKLYPGLRTVRQNELCLGFKDSSNKLQPFDLLNEGLKFTAKTGNHLFGLGEYFASYLFVWSDKVWPGIFREPKFAQEIAKLEEMVKAAQKKKKAPDDKRDQFVRGAESIFPDTFFEDLPNFDPDNEEKFNTYAEWFHLSINKDADKRAAARIEAAKRIAKGYVKLIESFFKFTITAQGVAKVRKGLANIATYMMFDDHEVTDDWHMTRDWVTQVYGSPTARRVMQNALCAYAVFQAWGNTPERFEGEQAGKKFLDVLKDWIQAKMPSGAQANAVLERVIPCKLLPNDKVEVPLLKDGALIGSEKVIRWDYRLSFGKYEALVTDARTRRSFPGRNLAPAEHLSHDAIKLQAPDALGAEFNPEFSLLVSPCNIVTIPDFRKGFVGTALPLKVGLSHIIGLVKGETVQKAALLNYDPDVADSWFVAEGPFELLLARLAARMPKSGNERLPARVVVLSGDVHFSASSRLQYWADKPFNETEGVANLVMAHLVSSGFKNENVFWHVLHHTGFETVDVFDDEKRLPKTEVLAGYAKKVNDLTPAELEKRKELIDKTRWFPNYKPSMLAPTEETAPSLLPYHQTDPAVKIPKPDWFYRIDHMRGKKPKPSDPNDPNLHKFENIIAGGFDTTLKKLIKNQVEHFKYGKNFAAGLELIALNSIAELTFGWEGSGKLGEAITANTEQFLIRVDKAFPKTPFQIIAGTEIIQVSKVEPFGGDIRVTECKRGIAKTTKEAHAADAPLRVRKLVSQTH